MEWGTHLYASAPSTQATPKLTLWLRLRSQNADDKPKQAPWHLGFPPSRAGEECQADPESEDSRLAKPTGHSKGSVNNGSGYFHCLTLLPHSQGPAARPGGPVTHERARVKWKRWRRPRKVMKERAGKLRVVTWQKGFSKSPDGQSHLKPPTNRLTQVPPFLQTPGEHRPERALTSQCSPGGKGQAG